MPVSAQLIEIFSVGEKALMDEFNEALEALVILNEQERRLSEDGLNTRGALEEVCTARVRFDNVIHRIELHISEHGEIQTGLGAWVLDHKGELRFEVRGTLEDGFDG